MAAPDEKEVSDCAAEAHAIHGKLCETLAAHDLQDPDAVMAAVAILLCDCNRAASIPRAEQIAKFACAVADGFLPLEIDRQSPEFFGNVMIGLVQAGSVVDEMLGAAVEERDGAGKREVVATQATKAEP